MNTPYWSGGSIVKDANDVGLKPTVEFQNIVNQLLSELQANYGEDGFQYPTAPAAEIANRLSFMGIGSALYDTTNDVLVIKKSSGLEKVLTAPY